MTNYPDSTHPYVASLGEIAIITKSIVTNEDGSETIDLRNRPDLTVTDIEGIFTSAWNAGFNPKTMMVDPEVAERLKEHRS